MNPDQTIRARAVLTFGDNSGVKASFSIPRANMSQTRENVIAIMQSMVDSNALHFDHLIAVTLPKGAKLIKTTRTPIVSV